MAYSPVAEAQDETPSSALHLYNRTCGPISVMILDDGECPKGVETCQVSIAYGERADVKVAGALPAALTYVVEGLCTDGRPTYVSGQCEATLITLSPKHTGDDASPLGSAMDTPCRSLSGDCAALGSGSMRNKMVTQRQGTVDLELGLCDAGADGVDKCQVQCRVR